MNYDFSVPDIPNQLFYEYVLYPDTEISRAILLWYNALYSAIDSINSFSVCEALECCDDMECTLEDVLDSKTIPEVVADISAYLIARFVAEGRLTGTRAARQLFRNIIRGIIGGTAP